MSVPGVVAVLTVLAVLAALGAAGAGLLAHLCWLLATDPRELLALAGLLAELGVGIGVDLARMVVG